MTISAAQLTGTFTGTGQSEDLVIDRPAGYQLDGFGTATVSIQGNTGDGWVILKLADDSTNATFTADRIGTIGWDGVNMRVRFDCSSHSSGTITYRLSKGNG